MIDDTERYYEAHTKHVEQWENDAAEGEAMGLCPFEYADQRMYARRTGG